MCGPSESIWAIDKAAGSGAAALGKTVDCAVRLAAVCSRVPGTGGIRRSPYVAGSLCAGSSSARMMEWAGSSSILRSRSGVGAPTCA